MEASKHRTTDPHGERGSNCLMPSSLRGTSFPVAAGWFLPAIPDRAVNSIWTKTTAPIRMQNPSGVYNGLLNSRVIVAAVWFVAATWPSNSTQPFVLATAPIAGTNHPAATEAVEDAEAFVAAGWLVPARLAVEFNPTLRAANRPDRRYEPSGGYRGR